MAHFWPRLSCIHIWLFIISDFPLKRPAVIILLSLLAALQYHPSSITPPTSATLQYQPSSITHSTSSAYGLFLFLHCSSHRGALLTKTDLFSHLIVHNFWLPPTNDTRLLFFFHCWPRCNISFHQLLILHHPPIVSFYFSIAHRTVAHFWPRLSCIHIWLFIISDFPLPTTRGYYSSFTIGHAAISAFINYSSYIIRPKALSISPLLIAQWRTFDQDWFVFTYDCP